MRICHDFSGLFPCYCPEYGPSRDTAQGEKRRFYRHNFDLGAAAEPASTQETLNWQAFSVGGHNRRHRNMTDASVMGCDAPARFF
jgi:hypothetical protein